MFTGPFTNIVSIDLEWCSKSPEGREERSAREEVGSAYQEGI